MGVDFPDYITSKGFVPISNQILGNSLLVIGYNWFKLGIFLYVSFMISCFVHEGAECLLFFGN